MDGSGAIPVIAMVLDKDREDLRDKIAHLFYENLGTNSLELKIAFKDFNALEWYIFPVNKDKLAPDDIHMKRRELLESNRHLFNPDEVNILMLFLSSHEDMERVHSNLGQAIG